MDSDDAARGISRRNLIASSAAAAAWAAAPAASLPTKEWGAGDVVHLLPTVSHDNLLLKASFRTPQAAVRLLVDGQGQTGRQIDMESRYWSFRVGSLTPDTVVVLMTAHGDVRTAVEAMKHGAADFLLKPVDLDAVSLIARRNIERSRITRRWRHEQQAKSREFGLDRIFGCCSKLEKAKDLVRRVSAIARDTAWLTCPLLPPCGRPRGVSGQVNAVREPGRFTCPLLPSCGGPSGITGQVGAMREPGRFTCPLLPSRGPRWGPSGQGNARSGMPARLTRPLRPSRHPRRGRAGQLNAPQGGT